MHIYIHMYVYLYMCLHIYIYMYLYVSMYFYVSIYPSIHPTIYLFIYVLHTRPYVCTKFSAPNSMVHQKRTRNSTPQKHLQWSSRPRKTLGIPILWEKKEFKMIEPTTRKGLAIANAFGALIFSSFFGEPLNLQKSI